MKTTKALKKLNMQINLPFLGLIGIVMSSIVKNKKNAFLCATNYASR